MLSHLAGHTANKGKYLEAPQEVINKFRHIQDANRRTYAGSKILIHIFYLGGRALKKRGDFCLFQLEIDFLLVR